MPLVSIVRHRLTDVVLYAERRGEAAIVSRVLVGAAGRRAAEALSGTASEPLSDESARMIREYLDGRVIDLSSIAAEVGAVSPFRSAVLNAARRIPYGSTRSYTELASLAGFPAAVRAAASVMRRNPLPLVIPCHRVVRSDGSAGAYCGAREGEDVALKKALLQLERSALKKRPLCR
ncbi:MAG: MGMT family protein [Chitinispirillaceae bacterium]|nr:MGMT family protein [Chitinispirillaceae bacterium]